MTRPELAKFVVRKMPGSNVVLVIIRSAAVDQPGGIQRRKDYCGVFSTDCPGLVAPWRADLGENTPVEQLASECQTRFAAPAQGSMRMCPVRADQMQLALRSDNASSGLRAQLRDLQVRQKEPERARMRQIEPGGIRNA